MTERMENALNHIKTSVDVDPWAMEEVERVFKGIDDAIVEIEEQRKSIHISAFVGCHLKGEYDDLYLNGKHSGLLLALEIIRKHTGISDEAEMQADYDLQKKWLQAK